MGTLTLRFSMASSPPGCFPPLRKCGRASLVSFQERQAKALRGAPL